MDSYKKYQKIYGQERKVIAVDNLVQKHPELFQSEHTQTFGVVQSTISKAFQ